MIITYSKLTSIRKKFKGEKIVLGSGVFDILHIGHIKYIKALKKLGDVVVIMVKSDQRVKAGKGPLRPIITEGKRAIVVDSIKGVDFTFISPPIPFVKGASDPTYEAVFKTLEPDIFSTENPHWKILDGISKTEVVIIKTKRKPLESTSEIIEHVLEKHNK